MFRQRRRNQNQQAGPDPALRNASWRHQGLCYCFAGRFDSIDILKRPRKLNSIPNVLCAKITILGLLNCGVPQMIALEPAFDGVVIDVASMRRVASMTSRVRSLRC